MSARVVTVLLAAVIAMAISALAPADEPAPQPKRVLVTGQGLTQAPVLAHHSH